MSKQNSRRARHFFGGTGFYIALFLCATALAVAGYWTLLPKHPADVEAVSPAPVSVPEEETPSMPEIEMDVPTGVPDTEPIPVFDTAAVPDIAPVEPQLIVPPLSGETIAAFSMETLAYNETLGDWRTHDGVDIAAQAGTHVLAACGGTVTSVGEDDLLGTRVVIAHDGGYVTTYANLQSIPTVSEGERVSAGQVVGAVGTTSLIESSSRPHLHFSVTKDGETLDPAEFLK